MKRKKWEYYTEQMSNEFDAFNETIQENGKEGWELISITLLKSHTRERNGNYTWLFKRELIETEAIPDVD